MEQINVSQLQHNCKELLQRANAGESFEVTRHGEPLALLGPLPKEDDPLERLIARGVVTGGGRGLAAALEEEAPLPPAPPGTQTGSERLAELRRDER
ncbi:type II toxin-antitoxin system Phd/YefM family antitoxin [Candidatus Poriferisodalis sp.]|uniref:type II toxin-antitoxin system Phd/YefM family antitoxin n=1 Tax=Candidatus Poriferisodalis sp. TaxID=3101277 RepID=UPI003B0272B3